MPGRGLQNAHSKSGVLESIQDNRRHRDPSGWNERAFQDDPIRAPLNENRGKVAQPCCGAKSPQYPLQMKCLPKTHSRVGASRLQRTEFLKVSERLSRQLPQPHPSIGATRASPHPWKIWEAVNRPGRVNPAFHSASMAPATESLMTTQGRTCQPQKLQSAAESKLNQTVWCELEIQSAVDGGTHRRGFSFDSTAAREVEVCLYLVWRKVVLPVVSRRGDAPSSRLASF